MILPPKAIIFDLDGTLYPLKGLSSHIFLKNILSLSYLRKLSRSRKPLAGINFENKDTLLEKFYQLLSYHSGHKTTKCEAWYKKKFYPAFIKALSHLKVYPEVIPVLIHLKEKGIKLAVFSDYDHIIPRLEELKIEPSLFDLTLSAETIGALKPHPKGFEQCLSLLSVSPAEALMIGDREDTDGEGATLCKIPFTQISDNWANISKTFLSW